MKPFSLLIKPASADCNLRCSYCFYLGHSEFYHGEKIHRMSSGVLERLIRSYMATEQPQYAFGWQGGEPTLMGLDFFRTAVELQKTYGRSGAVVANGLQTNGTLITNELADLFAEYNFLLGISLDGPPGCHDYYRRYGSDKPSHADVLRGIGILRQHSVPFNILTLANNQTGSQGHQIYRYLRDNGHLYHQYIPCVEFDAAGIPQPFSVTGEQWGDFLCAIFDEWYEHDTRTVSIRLFDSILSRLVEKTTTICHMGKNCCQYFVVEYNGDIFPCDFFVDKSLHIGNIATTTWEQAQTATVYREFGAHKSPRHTECVNCPWLTLCAGDCLKHRHYGATSENRISYLCSGWKQFFSHAIPGFRKLSERIVKERMLAAQGIGSPNSTIIGRNDQCPCGSGKKYKRCCMAHNKQPTR